MMFCIPWQSSTYVWMLDKRWGWGYNLLYHQSARKEWFTIRGVASLNVFNHGEVTFQMYLTLSFTLGVYVQNPLLTIRPCKVLQHLCLLGVAHVHTIHTWQHSPHQLEVWSHFVLMLSLYFFGTWQICWTWLMALYFIEFTDLFLFQWCYHYTNIHRMNMCCTTCTVSFCKVVFNLCS